MRCSWRELLEMELGSNGPNDPLDEPATLPLGVSGTSVCVFLCVLSSEKRGVVV